MTRLNIPLFVALAASLLAAIDGRANTLPHQRMIRKRLPGSFDTLPRWVGLQERADLLPGLGGNGNEPSGSGSSAVASRTTSAEATTPTASASKAETTSTAANESTSSLAVASNSVSSVQNTQSASTTSGGLLNSLTALLSGTQTTSTVSSTSTTISTTSSVATRTTLSSVAPTTTSEPPKATPPTPTLNIATPPPASSNAPSQTIAVVTSIASEAAASQQAEQKARTAKITKNTIISLVVIASCVGGAVAIWTVIRKWKLSPSEKFDDRMQPIDWAPTTGATGTREETIEEKRHRRAGSAGSHGSFTSGGVGQSELGHGNGARSVYSDNAGHNMQQPHDFPPPHDFTAGPTNYGQYYQGQQQYGYADLQRGPSVTESTYSHGASVTRGLSYNRGHGGYDAQPGAGGVPPLPNPYGGGYEYEDYGRQQPQGQGQGQYRAY